jgi:hypothetical protein
MRGLHLATLKSLHAQATTAIRLQKSLETKFQFRLTTKLDNKTPTKLRKLRREHWWRGSLPILGINLLEFIVDDSIDTLRLLVEVFESSSKPHPWFLFTLQAGLELLRDSFRHKSAQWDATLGCDRFGAAEDGVWNLEGGLHRTMVPYLWETVNPACRSR